MRVKGFSEAHRVKRVVAFVKGSVGMLIALDLEKMQKTLSRFFEEYLIPIR